MQTRRLRAGSPNGTRNSAWCNAPQFEGMPQYWACSSPFPGWLSRGSHCPWTEVFRICNNSATLNPHNAPLAGAPRGFRHNPIPEIAPLYRLSSCLLAGLLAAPPVVAAESTSDNFVEETSQAKVQTTWIWQKKAKSSADALLIPVASGLFVGGSLMAVGVSFFTDGKEILESLWAAFK